MNEQNPTCGTCRWGEFEFGEDYGYCFYAPPLMLEKLSCALSYERPGIWRNNFCSKHNQPTHEDQVLRYMVGQPTGKIPSIITSEQKEDSE